ncbi:unnamed protein product [Phytophthora lilii]|uniref:Unnamed protein product n=1 Tax=Phytophthora lilii TaxID=2077276 RepID=A0A9W6YL30_9STRA|nr:unnamed protein product [Phytophthora lilii]
MWKRQVANQQSRERSGSEGDAAMARISLPSGEQIHDISTKDRFASTAAYRSSTFASVVKEPYADPQAVGPGTYRAPRRAIIVKKQQVPTPTYISKAARFEEANAQVTAVLALASPTATSPNEREYMLDSSPRGAGGGGHSSPDKVRGPVLSTTPRFKSDVFPGAVFAAISLCPHSETQEAAMVHNTPNFPILASATQETVGPGAYSPTSKAKPPEDVNFIMMPQHVRCLPFSSKTNPTLSPHQFLADGPIRPAQRQSGLHRSSVPPLRRGSGASNSTSPTAQVSRAPIAIKYNFQFPFHCVRAVPQLYHFHTSFSLAKMKNYRSSLAENIQWR